MLHCYINCNEYSSTEGAVSGWLSLDSCYYDHPDVAISSPLNASQIEVNRIDLHHPPL